MKNRGKNMVTLTAGIVLGIALAGPAVQAAEEAYLRAFPSTQTFYVDGQRVELEAYGINGHNYVKLRDIGQAVGFNIYYDAERNAAMMESGQPYTGEAPKVDMASPGNDYSAQANPSIFTGELTREAYNGIRDAVVNREAVLSGRYQAAPITRKVARSGDIHKAALAIGCYPIYEVTSQGDGAYICNVRQAEAYQAIADHTQSFINGLASLSQRGQVEQIVWYVCDRLNYSTSSASIKKVLGQDGVTAGNCMVYAESFQFLCDRAGIPCIRLQSTAHQWNRVYVDGQWWDVDVTGDDVPDTNLRRKATILHPLGEKDSGLYEDASPEVTAFAMELLAPGSTK